MTFRSQNVVTPQAADRIVHLYEGGLTIREVVKQVGYSFGTVQRGTVDRHSNKSALVPPPPRELARFAHQSRVMQSGPTPVNPQDAPVRSLRRRLSPQQIEELVARYNVGEDTPALSRAYGISRGGLRKLLLTRGVSFRKQPMTPEDAERAVRLYERGLTIDQVVEQVGYSFSTIRRMLHANGVAVRERGGGKRVANDG